MTFSPQDCVIDASVGIKLFLQQPQSEQAHQLFAPLVRKFSSLYQPRAVLKILCRVDKPPIVCPPVITT